MEAMTAPTTLSRYRLVQRSDDYEFDAADDETATLLVCLLGEAVGWRCEDRWFLNLLCDPEELEGILGLKMADALGVYGHRLVDALLTVEIAPELRRRSGMDPDAWHERHVGGSFDYRSVARRLATTIGDRLPERP